MRSPGWLGGAALCLALGCRQSPPNCEPLIGAINPTLRQVARLSRPLGKDVELAIASRLEIAQQYRALAGHVATLRVTDKQLKRHASNYAQLARQAADLLKENATALEKEDTKVIEDTRKAFEKLRQTELELSNTIMHYCGQAR